MTVSQLEPFIRSCCRFFVWSGSDEIVPSLNWSYQRSTILLHILVSLSLRSSLSIICLQSWRKIMKHIDNLRLFPPSPLYNVDFSLKKAWKSSTSLWVIAASFLCNIVQGERGEDNKQWPSRGVSLIFCHDCLKFKKKNFTLWVSFCFCCI